MSKILETTKKELLSWPDVTAKPHRFGGIEFRLKIEMGHIHGDRVADLPFPMDVRNKLVKSGRVSAHVIQLFKMRYDSLKPDTKIVTRST